MNRRNLFKKLIALVAAVPFVGKAVCAPQPSGGNIVMLSRMAIMVTTEDTRKRWRRNRDGTWIDEDGFKWTESKRSFGEEMVEWNRRVNEQQQAARKRAEEKMKSVIAFEI